MALEEGLVLCPTCEGTFLAKIPKMKKGLNYNLECKHCNSEIRLLSCGVCEKIMYKDKECKECLKPKDLELTDEMVERNDEICTAVFECMKVLAEKELNWDMHAIEDALEQMKCVIESVYGVKVRDYSIVTNEDGSQSFDDGLEDEAPAMVQIPIKRKNG